MRIRDWMSDVCSSELGAALCLIVGDRVVIDLQGGWRDAARTSPWEADTVVNLWSTTKGVGAICFAILADRGLMAYDDLVADQWPALPAERSGARRGGNECGSTCIVRSDTYPTH